MTQRRIVLNPKQNEFVSLSRISGKRRSDNAHYRHSSYGDTGLRARACLTDLPDVDSKTNEALKQTMLCHRSLT